MANSRVTRNRPASAGPSGTSRQGNRSPPEQSTVGEPLPEFSEAIPETQVTETLESGEDPSTVRAPFRSRYAATPLPSAVTAQDFRRLELENQALRRTQEVNQQQITELYALLTNRPPEEANRSREAVPPPPPSDDPSRSQAIHDPTPLAHSSDTVPAPPAAATRVVYEKAPKKPTPIRFESKNFQEYERWIEDVKNNFDDHDYSERTKVRTAASWLGGLHQTQWIEYKRSIDLSRFTFDDFVEWIEGRVEAKAARSMNASIRLAKLTMPEMGNPQTFYTKFSHEYDLSHPNVAADDSDKIQSFIAKLPDWLLLKVMDKNHTYRDMIECLEEVTRLWDLYKDEQKALNKVLKRNRDGDDNDESNDKPRKGRFNKNRNRRGGFKGKKDNDHKPKGNSREDKSKLVCFRCDRPGHRSTECRATHHRDGTALKPKDNQKPKPQLHSLSQKQQDEEDNDNRDDQ